MPILIGFGFIETYYFDQVDHDFQYDLNFNVICSSSCD